MDIHEEFWGLKRNLAKHIELRKLYDGYCFSCNKPIRNFSIRCTGCQRKVITSGSTDNNVHPLSFGTIGNSVINHQQYLHRSMFGCNVGVPYRGIKEDRLKTKIPTHIQDIGVRKLHNYILSINNEFSDFYKTIHAKRHTITKRILYNIFLHYIAYYKDNNPMFVSEAHFMATVTYNYHTTISRQYYNTHKDKSVAMHDLRNTKSIRKNYSTGYYYRLFECLDGIMGDWIKSKMG